MKELEGVPSDVLSGYKKRPAEGDTPELYEVTFKTPDIVPLVCLSILNKNSKHLTWMFLFQFKFASNPETRRRASEAFEDRLSINEPLFKKGLALRRRIAKLLGYKTWADYITEVKMVKTADNVFTV